ncbi:MAG: methylenetetrahydrofolate reductase [NAD(P)H] [Gammaproteobacteria bacterium]|nr:methylenetetrahydrofolate reductase [NAD(P)H] [Gammaproteobacteria bacterium]
MSLPASTCDNASAQELSFSFELFPPRSLEAAARLSNTVAQLAVLQPAYFSITYGAGGSTQAGTYDTVIQVVEHTGVEAAPHLTCVGSRRAGIDEQLRRYRDAGIRRLVALRGDLPATAASADAPGEFHHALDLVRYVRQTHDDHFRLEVAAYPETHPQATDTDADFRHFQEKVAAGADCALTQYFFNADAYFDFLNRCHRVGISIPIVPGIMPITNHAQLTRFSAACGAEIPRYVRLRLEKLADDKPALLDFGLEVVSRLCERLLDGGAPGLHIYTLNQAEPTLRLWRNLSMPVPSAAAGT